MPRPRKYPDELMERGVRLVFESGVRSHGSPLTWVSITRRCGSVCARRRRTAGSVPICFRLRSGRRSASFVARVLGAASRE